MTRLIPFVSSLCFGLVMVAGPLAFADHTPGIEKFSILGEREALPTQPGSAHVINELELEKFDFSDIHRILRSVPGVNIQEEDGLGLRPNIGLRGAHPHRSKKISLMEDGVLIAPAPYSAPAAYYFPAIDKIYTFEVFKGASSVKYGPHSVGGAINMISWRHEPGAKFDARFGSFNAQKYHAAVGVDALGGTLSFDGLRASHDGFKRLPFDGNTGFERHNFFARYDKDFSSYEQTLTLKVNWSNEESRETYLGLSNQDFAQDEFQRYSASSMDKMQWEHKQYFANYEIVPVENLRLKSTLYFHQFYRSWNKFDGFFDKSIDPASVLNDPSLIVNNDFYNVIRGTQDSGLPGNADTIRLTDNNREYLSGGAQFSANYNWMQDDVEHDITLGYRLHKDQVRRNHLSSFYDMRSGRLNKATLADEVLRQNFERATAHTVTLQDDIQFSKLQVSVVSRFEKVDYTSEDFLKTTTAESSESAVAPGVGTFYQLYSKGGILAGVHKGVTLVGPGQASQVEPEEAINYELGFRHSNDWGLETILFYSDYQNILGTCTISSGCSADNLDTQFNGGRAAIFGLELLSTFEPKYKNFTFPIRITGTFTQTEFQNSFQSTNTEWGQGRVQVGDPIPYIPTFQGQVMAGIKWNKWQTFLGANYVGEMADQAVAQGRKTVPSFWVMDVSLHYNFSKTGKVYFKGDNILNEKYAVSFRPSGLRPGMPFSLFAGVKYEL